MMDRVIGEQPVCFKCQRFKMEFGSWHCDAFPKGIPEKILTGEIDHKQRIKGDNGLIFKPK